MTRSVKCKKSQSRATPRVGFWENEFMGEVINTRPEEDENAGLREKISGLGQKIIGEIETIGGILTADPMTEAEGEFNLEVGTLREEMEDRLEDGEKAK